MREIFLQPHVIQGMHSSEVQEVHLLPPKLKLEPVPREAAVITGSMMMDLTAWGIVIVIIFFILIHFH